MRGVHLLGDRERVGVLACKHLMRGYGGPTREQELAECE